MKCLAYDLLQHWANNFVMIHDYMIHDYMIHDYMIRDYMIYNLASPEVVMLIPHPFMQFFQSRWLSRAFTPVRKVDFRPSFKANIPFTHRLC
jgi:hypothetical protein